MRSNRWPWLLAGLLSTAVPAGCQTFNRDESAANNSRPQAFGLDYVPRQSEPPIETADSTSRSPSQSSGGSRARLDDSSDDGSKKANALTRFMTVRQKEAPSKPLPVSATLPSSAEGTRESQSE